MAARLRLPAALKLAAICRCKSYSTASRVTECFDQTKPRAARTASKARMPGGLFAVNPKAPRASPMAQRPANKNKPADKITIECRKSDCERAVNRPVFESGDGARQTVGRIVCRFLSFNTLRANCG